jgi:bacilliredoxin
MKPLDIAGPMRPSGALYDERLVAPMREELTSLGFRELRTPAEVDGAIPGNAGTMLLMVNSVCGCAAGRARPGVRLALQQATIRPQQLATVFAGQDREATARAREYFEGQSPTSPQVALFKDGRLVYLMQRHQIEGREAPAIAADLTAAFAKYCG